MNTELDERLARPPVGQMTISVRLAEINDRLTSIERQVTGMERCTKDIARNLETLMVSIRAHPLISRFLVKSGG